MEYQRNQKNGINLSRVGLGCGSMVNSVSIEAKNKSIDVIHGAIDEGITFFNTADFYGSGSSEMILGEGLKGYNRDKAFVSLKFGALVEPNGRMYGLDVKTSNIKNYIAYSLKRLNLDYIDLYQPGRIDLGIPVEETIGAIADLVKEGYVKNIGLTQVDAETLRRANAVHPISFVEAEYSIFNRSIEENIIPTARELGIGIVTFGSLAHGILSGSWTKETKSRYGSVISMFAEENIEHNLILVESLKKIAKEKNITLPELSLAWILAKGEDIIPLIGTNNKSNLEKSLRALEVNLTEDDMKRIERAVPIEDIKGNTFPNMKFKNGVIVR